MSQAKHFNLPDIPVEVLLDNLLPFVPVRDLLSLTCCNKVCSFGSFFGPFLNEIQYVSFFPFFVRMTPYGNASYLRISTSQARELLAPVAGNLSIAVFLNHEVVIYTL